MSLLSLMVLALVGAVIAAIVYTQRRAQPAQTGRPVYRYCPWCAADLELGDIEGKRRLKCTKCQFVHWDNPRPVAVVLIPSGNGLVLIKRLVEPRAGKFALPGGFVEPYELPAQGAVREAKEETGIDIEIDRLLGIVMPPKVNEVLFFYLAKPTSQQPVKGSDAAETGVYDRNSLPAEIAFSTHKDAIEQYFAEAQAVQAKPTGIVPPVTADNFLYPDIEPYNSGRLKVSDLHEIYFEECGNPQGKPVVFVHGGPGGGISPKYRRFFNPSKYRIVLFDQRGCGKSTPHASIEQNTTWDLVEDMEKIRQHLGIERWQVFGGSWGSTLALAYAETHRERVTELVLRGIFLLRKKELAWFYQEGASNLFPDAWEHYLAAIPAEERGDLMQAYHKRLTAEDENVRVEAARAWSIWEGSTSKLFPEDDFVARYGDPTFALAFARIECHYFVNGGFLKHENQLLDNVSAVRNIPAVIVQGRYDVVCPMTSAWDLHRAWPEADFVLVKDAGHSALEAGIARELVAATDKFAS